MPIEIVQIIAVYMATVDLPYPGDYQSRLDRYARKGRCVILPSYFRLRKPSPGPAAISRPVISR